MIIAIDGEASSGKSTQAKKVADYFGYSYLDSGAFYRAITLFFKKRGIITANRIGENDLNKISLNSKYDDGKNSIYLNDEDVSNDIRSTDISEIVSDFAKEKNVREHVYKHLREFSENRSTVIDGRDIGTHVYPNPDVNFLLYQKPENREKRITPN